MTLEDLKAILEDFDLWRKVAPFATSTGLNEKGLEEAMTKFSTSEKLIINAILDVYHDRKGVYFRDLVRYLDKANTLKMLQWWLKDFERDLDIKKEV